jgi:isopentenyl-diphosphate delta-isomerase
MTEADQGTHELVQLVDEDGALLGTAAKATVHTEHTPLHLAFSCHVFGPDGRVLVTRRALSKKTWPGVWTNAFCGHPAPGEAFDDAIRRRAEQELGLELGSIEPVLPEFRYRAVDASGIVEYEICPVFRAVTASDPQANPDEVAEWAWSDSADFRAAVAAAPYAFSPWLVLQLDALAAQGR